MAADVPEVVAVGVNCCSADTADRAVALARTAGRPAVVYPNSGEEWDGAGRRWLGDPTFGPARVGRWVEKGARLVGGCCRVGPTGIAAVAALVTGGDSEHAPLRND